MAITSQIKASMAVGEVKIAGWQNAGLLKASVVKPVLTTIEKKLVLRQLGQLEPTDCLALQQALNMILG
ncbi:MAG TPA: hypothetical protein VGC89_13870 [Pyrinomonadaceae bacterium]|jgi:mRNA interferase MazF